MATNKQMLLHIVSKITKKTLELFSTLLGLFGVSVLKDT